MSDAGQYIREQVDANWRSIQSTRSLGYADLFVELEELAEEYGVDGWDGYGAMAVSPSAIQEAERFLRALPMGPHRPTLGAEPDGHVTLEWHVSAKRTLSVSISPEGEIHFAALIGTTRDYGTIPFLGECPDRIIQLVQRVRGV
ncbi:MAG: hypothetical protein ACYC26_14190 [Phycisphaerales bacterium]